MEPANEKIIIHHVITREELAELIKMCIRDIVGVSVKPVESVRPVENERERERILGGEEPQEEDRLFTVKEFADYFRVSQNTIRAWLKKGKIPFIRIHKRIRIRRSEILKLERRRGL